MEPTVNLCSTCEFSDKSDTEANPYEKTGYRCYNLKIAKMHGERFYPHASVCEEYEEVHMEFKVGDKVTIVDPWELAGEYNAGDTAVVVGDRNQGSLEIRMFDGKTRLIHRNSIKLTPTCIQGDICDTTKEATCCYECPRKDECEAEGISVCDAGACEKHEDYVGEELQIAPEDESCVCPMCQLEEALADAYEEIDMLKDELLASQAHIIQLLLEKQKEPQIWQ